MESTSNLRRPLKVGFCLPTDSTNLAPRPWSEISDLAHEAVDAGFDSLWLFDHMRLTNIEPELRRRAGAPIPEGIEEVPVGYWECCSMLGAIAATNPGIELGTLVICTGYRNPALLAKIADTIDEITGGRFILGLGSGDSAEEHEMFGFPTDHLVGRFEEAVVIIKTLLTQRHLDYEGQYYRLRDCDLRPRGPRPAGPPIMIGTLNPGPRMQRLVAQHADVWNAWLAYGDCSPEASRAQQAIIEDACRRYGRDPRSLDRTAAVQVALPGYESQAFASDRPITGNVEEIAAMLRAHSDAGINHLQLWIYPSTVQGVRQFKPILELMKS